MAGAAPRGVWRAAPAGGMAARGRTGAGAVRYVRVAGRGGGVRAARLALPARAATGARAAAANGGGEGNGAGRDGGGAPAEAGGRRAQDAVPLPVGAPRMPATPPRMPATPASLGVLLVLGSLGAAGAAGGVCWCLRRGFGLQDATYIYYIRETASACRVRPPDETGGDLHQRDSVCLHHRSVLGGAREPPSISPSLSLCEGRPAASFPL